MDLIEFVTDSLPISANGQTVESNCIDIMFVNYGTATLTVNNAIRIPPPATAGQFNFFKIGGNIGEIDRSKYVCKFTGGGTNDAVAIRRLYKNN